MPNTRKPRSGSLQFWPRKRASRSHARIRTYPDVKEPGLTGFAGYKVGMTKVMAIETNKKSPKKGEEISVPVTILECPPLRIAAIRLYKKDSYGMNLSKEMLLTTEKSLSKILKLPKKINADLDKIKAEEYEDIRVLVFTKPSLTKIGKKAPDLFEMGLGGSNQEKVDYVKNNVGKDILLESIFKEGDLADLKSVTKGKGFQGPVKRFGVTIRQAKSEKSIRNPGSLGPWNAQGHIMWRVAHAGKMGYHQRTEYNKQIISIADKDSVNPKGGFVNYGKVENKALLIKGSVAGAKKRLVILQKPLRMKKPGHLPTVTKISVEEPQGN